MTPVVLFDWGDTLMVDFPGYSGKMCDWPAVTEVPGASQALECLSRRSRLYVASGALDSSAGDIRRALARIDVDRYITDVFCQQNIGFKKTDPRFFQAILASLGVRADEVTMIGDSLEKDILPCHRLGMRAILLAEREPPPLPHGVSWIRSLHELCIQT
jgi:putative hydrolase of the HAD superfamily